MVFDQPPGSYDICPICFWEDDWFQILVPAMHAGANGITLIEAQHNYASCGACEPTSLDSVRQPNPDEQRDPTWRPFDPMRDFYDDASPPPGRDERVYYWRPEYWRRQQTTPGE